MNAQGLTQISAIGRRRTLLVSLAATIVVALTGLAQQASAFSSSQSGTPGTVSFTVGALQGSHLSLYAGSWSPYLSHQGLDVCRSGRTTGYQRVEAHYSVQYTPGGSTPWRMLGATGSAKAGIYAGTNCMRLPAWSQTFTSPGFYYVGVTFTWYDSYGYRLGTITVAFNGNDYSCATFRPCTPYRGYIYLG